jgi:prepilin-type processing-associated H-X9-DG protein
MERECGIIDWTVPLRKDIENISIRGYRHALEEFILDPSNTNYDCHRDLRCRGIFFRHSYRRPVKIAKVTDGTSKTLMIGEDVPDYNLHSTAYYSNGDWCSCNLPLNHGMALAPQHPPFLATWWEGQAFRSKHPGGVHFCLVDGSVRFLVENMDNTTFRTSCTRNGDETTTEGL